MVVLFRKICLFLIVFIFARLNAFAQDTIHDRLEPIVVKNILAKLSYERIVYNGVNGCGAADCISHLIDCDRHYQLYFERREDLDFHSTIQVYEYRGFGEARGFENGEHILKVIPRLSHFHGQARYSGLVGLSSSGRVWLLSGMMHLDPIKQFFWSSKNPSFDEIKRYIAVRYFNYDLKEINQVGGRVRAYASIISQDVVFKIGKEHGSKDVVEFVDSYGRWRKRVEH
jgi:hypothetical protein